MAVPSPGMSTASPPADSLPQAASPNPFAAAPGPERLPPENPFADQPSVSPNPYAPPSSPSVLPGAYVQPHRGGIVLALGIAGLCCVTFGFCCMPFGILALPIGIVALVLGAADLKKMRQGNMDPSGRGLTLAGIVMGIITNVLMALALLLFVVAFVFGQMHHM